ncbi:MAG: hypothetical protein HY695_12885 [Deltaproteobacteria bacterium]|nr:hypothetical protein [Deltaproteobacteria bacterium]
MFEDLVPRRKVGCLFPLTVIDYNPYEFYQMAPKGIMLVLVPLGLENFTREDVERVFAPIDQQIEALLRRGIDIVVQAGVPLTLLVGPAFLDRLLAHIEKKAGVPAISMTLCVAAAAKHLGLKKVAVANKWNEQMNATLGEFFAREGVSVAGAFTRSMAPSQFLRMGDLESMQLAYELGRGALEEYPDADGLYIGGAAWLTLPLVERLEKEFGKPVITNQVATMWQLLHRLDCWSPISGYGQLLEGR